MQSKRSDPTIRQRDGRLQGADPTRLLSQMPERYSRVVKNWAERAPHRRALHFAGRNMSYSELWSATVDAIALLKGIGVRAGDRVMLVGENGLQIVPLLLAASEIDAWAAPLNARMSWREIESIRDFAECRRVIYCVGDSGSAEQHAKSSGANESAELLGPLVIGALNDQANAEQVFPDMANQTAVLVFTSGTTGAPKGVRVSHQALIYMGANMAEIRQINSDDVFYNSSPISHAIGLGTVLMTAFWAGASAELVSKFTAEHFVEALRQERISSVTAVPTLFARILDFAEQKGISLRSKRLRIIATAGAPLDMALKSKVESAFGLRMGNSYGMTECNPIARSAAGVETNEVGELQPGVTVRIVRDDGEDAGVDERGELWAKGPSLMLGYYRNKDATQAAMRPDGFLATGDLATVDAMGRLYIVGRSKELIIRSGFNVYPAEVEAVLALYPGVAQVAVVGRQVEGNEEVVAFVQPTHGVVLDTDALAHFARDRLAPYKRPAEIILQSELPVGPTGKIYKSLLRDIAAN